MALIRNFVRALAGEAIINELPETMSREQILLQADPAGYQANTILAKITGGANVGQWGKFDPAGANGLNVAKGYLFGRGRPASTGTARVTALVRTCDLNGKKVVWDTATPITASQIAAAIAQLQSLDVTLGMGGIRVRF